MPNKIRRILTTAMCALMLLMCAPCAMASDKNSDDILIVSSYSMQYNWSNRVQSKLDSIVHAKHKTVSTLNLPLASV